MPKYIAVLKHDNGTCKIKTFASCKMAAKLIIMNAELCPESAIQSIRNKKRRVAIIDTGAEVVIRRTAPHGDLWTWLKEFTTLTDAAKWCKKKGYSYIDIDLTDK